MGCELKTDCRIFGKSSVPWCYLEEGEIVPEGLFSKEGKTYFPLLLVWTSSAAKVQNLVDAYRMVRARNSKIKVENIFQFEGGDLGDEPEYRRGMDISDDKGQRGMRMFWEKHLADSKNSNSCILEGRCWRIPRLVFLDTKVSLYSACYQSKQYQHKLSTQLNNEYGVSWKKQIGNKDWMQGYLLEKYRKMFPANELMVVGISSGVTIGEFGSREKKGELKEGEWKLWSAGLKTTYSIPTNLVRGKDFINEYLSEVIAQRPKGLIDMLGVPMGLFSEIMIGTVERCEPGSVIYKVNEKDYELIPQSHVIMNALGTHPLTLEALLNQAASGARGDGILSRAPRKRLKCV